MEHFWNGFEKASSASTSGLVTEYGHEFPLNTEEAKSKYKKLKTLKGALVGGVLGSYPGLIAGLMSSGLHDGKNLKSRAALGALAGTALGAGIGGGWQGFKAKGEADFGRGTTTSWRSPLDAQIKSLKYTEHNK